jgi:hypothetical protein
LQSALTARDFEAIRRIGHNLHGSGVPFDLEALSTMGCRIERAAERADASALDVAFAELEAFLAGIPAS